MRKLILYNKNKSILNLFNEIISIFGEDYFDTYEVENRVCIIDFWDSDLCAIGLKKDNKVVYLSNWDFRSKKEMRYYAEFENIDIKTMETINTIKKINEIDKANLILELKNFFTCSP